MAGKDRKAAQGKAKEWQVEWLEINSLNPYENNARKNDATIPYLKNSIQRFGFRVPLVIGKGNVVVCGHTRLKAALELGMEKLPCVRADDLTDAELKAFRLADNKVQELSGWDFEKLDAEMEQLKIDFDGDMVDFGFDAGFEDQEPQDLEGEERAKPFQVKITFPDEKSLNDWLAKVRTQLEENYNASISVSGGEL